MADESNFARLLWAKMRRNILTTKASILMFPNQFSQDVSRFNTIKALFFLLQDGIAFSYSKSRKYLAITRCWKTLKRQTTNSRLSGKKYTITIFFFGGGGGGGLSKYVSIFFLGHHALLKAVCEKNCRVYPSIK